MQPELEERLFEACPLLYHYLATEERQENLNYGIEATMGCKEGWFSLLWDLSAEIEGILQSLPPELLQECRPPPRQAFSADLD